MITLPDATSSAAYRSEVPFADVGVGLAGRCAGQHRQHWCGSIQRLHLSLLVDAQHHGGVRRVQIQPDDIADLVDELHPSPNPACPVGRNISSALDARVRAVERAMERGLHALPSQTSRPKWSGSKAGDRPPADLPALNPKLLSPEIHK